MPFYTPPVTTRQCVQFPAFKPPALDGSVTLVEAYDWHLEHSPEHVYYKYEDIDGSIGTIKWKEAVLAAYRAAHIVRGHADNNAKFAILAVSDSITFGATLMGCMRAGFPPFLVSPRNSPEVIAGLLDKAEITHVFYSPDVATTKHAKAGTAHRPIQLIPLPTLDQLYSSDDVTAPPPVKPGFYDNALIIHSSGSTSVPKLLPVSHSTLFLMGASAWWNEIDLGSMTMNFAPTPMYHLMGSAHLAIATYSGVQIAVFPPTIPPVQPTAENFLHSIVATKSNITMIMPSILESLSHVPADVQKLARMDLVLYGGAALKPSAGDRLVEGGVKLMPGLGMSEAGVLCALITRPLGRDWQWIRQAPYNKLHYRDLEDGTYELISHDGHYVDTPNCEYEGKRALATKDVVVRHPTDPGLFKIVGRLDDQLVLSTGEKTNAIPLEAILTSDSLIERAVVFGRGRPHNGVIIQPRGEQAFDPNDLVRLAEFRDAIWPTVVKMNEFAPSHSRIAKEMIIVTSPSKPLPVNPTKNTVIRALATAAYEQEILDAYDTFSLAEGGEFQPPATWELTDTVAFIRKVVRTVVPDLPSDNDDLFNYGCDSLKAARIHNNIVGALRATNCLSDGFPGESPYKFPTIKSLAAFVSTSGLSGHAHVDLKALKIAEVEAMLAKYSSSFPTHAPSPATATESAQLVFLVTGTTGGLGTNLLAQLLGQPEVKRVYALNRRGPPGTSLLDRHKVAFIDRGVDPALLDLDKFVLLEGDTAQSELGIHPAVYEEMRTAVTHIIHNAWPVNFNYAVQTFEGAVRGSKNLVDFALKSTRTEPPRFTFISSVGVSRNAGSEVDLAPEEPILDLNLVVGQGYPESKWVVERMLQIAAERTPLKSVSIRVGQLAGGHSGCWNASDWLPVIVRSAAKLSCLPDASAPISWIRLDEAAASVIEMRDASGVLHLVHPRPVPWRTAFDTFSRTLGNVPIVPFSDWMGRLIAYAEANPEGGREVPAMRLLEYYKGIGPTGFDGMARVENISTVKAQVVSPTLRNMAPMSEVDAEKWIAYWKRAGVL
ncbi:acetyl-CoA synthetase-like protein [Exidia glandulosa HHB12029]|uniref:Acetyl-CoA synthetase-like protein n=1 Tax=Exidia glandulosa HHB12029 TaxID=1314781 RepID=A0A165K323_EXIGL|nr:acetyl-CoA synthetase-like protein [Exidia glandulosa HHB12029]